MGYSVAFLGDLKFGSSGAARWLASKIDASAFDDWPPDWTPEIDGKLTVGKLLDQAKGDFHELERGPAAIRLRLLVSKDDGFYSGRRMEMLCAFRQAAAHGGTGSLAILGWSDAPQLPKSPLIAAIAAHADARATQVMRDALRDLLGGPLAGEEAWRAGENGYLANEERILACSLVWALHRRGGAEDAVADVWIDHPDFFLRNHEAVRALGRRELDLRLVAQLGQKSESTDSHDWIIEALIATDPEGAPRRATELLAGDPREKPGNLAALESLARYFYDHQDQRSPAWEQWLRDVERSHPWSDETYDEYDQMRRNAIGMMVNWKMPEALAPITEHFEAFGVERACGLLEDLGDRAAVPTLEARLAETRRKPDRTRIEAAIQKLGGPSAAKKKSTSAKAKKPKSS